MSSGECLQEQDLNLQLDDALQQLFQLSHTLQGFAKQNMAHSQQLQLQCGVTSKVKRELEQYLLKGVSRPLFAQQQASDCRLQRRLC